MASEIAWRHSGTAKNVYVTIRNSARLYWNKDTDAPALEALAIANWYNAAATDGNYWIALTETPGSSYFYVGDWPALLTAVGFYWLDVYERVGATPAISDTLIGGIIGYWNGTALLPWAADTEQVGGTAQTAGDMLGVWTPTKAGYLTGAVALEATLTAIKGAGWTTETLVAIKTVLDAIAAYGGGTGTGTYTDTITDGVNPLDGVRVQLSTDAGGSNRVYEAFTDALGVFSMSPDPGTYYRWIDLARYTGAQGVQVVVP